MATAPKQKKKETVSKKTFLTWSCHADFDYEVDADNNVIKLTCKICVNNIQQIRVEAKHRGLRGSVLDSLLKYADGIDHAHKGNVYKHVKSGGLHDWAKKKFSNTTAEDIPTAPHETREKNQPTLQAAFFSQTTKSNYTRLFVTALHIALKERPISDFPDLIDLQKKNGLKFFDGKTHEMACAEFIDILANVITDDIKNILSEVKFFSITMDGSQPRKTATEKELLYVKLVIRGRATELLLKCIHMNDYGGDAIDLERAILYVLKETFAIPEERLNNLMVSCCADGASINMGK